MAQGDILAQFESNIDDITSVKYNSNTNNLIFSDDDAIINICNKSDGSIISQISKVADTSESRYPSIYEIDVLENGNIVFCEYARIGIIDSDGNILSEYTDFPSSVMNISLINDETEIISSSEVDIYKTNISDGNTEKIAQFDTGFRVYDLDVNNDETKVIATEGDHALIFELATGDLLSNVRANGSWSVAFFNDDTKYAYGEYENLHIRDSDTDDLIYSIDFTSYDYIRKIKFSVNDSYIAVGFNNGDIKIVETDTGDIIYTFTEHSSDYITDIAWGEDRTEILSSNNSLTGFLWESGLGTPAIDVTLIAAFHATSFSFDTYKESTTYASFHTKPFGFDAKRVVDIFRKVLDIDPEITRRAQEKELEITRVAEETTLDIVKVGDAYE